MKQNGFLFCSQTGRFQLVEAKCCWAAKDDLLRSQQFPPPALHAFACLLFFSRRFQLVFDRSLVDFEGWKLHVSYSPNRSYFESREKPPCYFHLSSGEREMLKIWRFKWIHVRKVRRCNHLEKLPNRSPKGKSVSSKHRFSGARCQTSDCVLGGQHGSDHN